MPFLQCTALVNMSKVCWSKNIFLHNSPTKPNVGWTDVVVQGLHFSGCRTLCFPHRVLDVTGIGNTCQLFCYTNNRRTAATFITTIPDFRITLAYNARKTCRPVAAKILEIEVKIIWYWRRWVEAKKKNKRGRPPFFWFLQPASRQDIAEAGRPKAVEPSGWFQRPDAIILTLAKGCSTS
jgi:hypothetical protein